jgi:hypothetical protein
MNPPGPVAEVTRMSVPVLPAGWHWGEPYDVVPTTFCWLCGAPAGMSAGPPLSPEHVPPIPPPWACVNVLPSTETSMVSLAAMLRRVLFWLLSEVMPKPT